jgi:hypothetical protein
VMVVVVPVVRSPWSVVPFYVTLSSTSVRRLLAYSTDVSTKLSSVDVDLFNHLPRGIRLSVYYSDCENVSLL